MPTQNNSVRVNFDMPVVMHEELKKYCKAHDTTISQFLRGFVRDVLSRERHIYEILKQYPDATVSHDANGNVSTILAS